MMSRETENLYYKPEEWENTSAHFKYTEAEPRGRSVTKSIMYEQEWLLTSYE